MHSQKKTVKLSSMKRARVSKVTDSLPHLDEICFEVPQHALFSSKQASTHPPKILMLYGSLRERSYSKLLTLEAARLLAVSYTHLTLPTKRIV